MPSSSEISGKLVLPRLYVILDAVTLAARELDLRDTAAALLGAGVTLMQYRDKIAFGSDLERRVIAVRETLQGSNCRLILNDDPEMARRTGCDGVHVGQGDLGVAQARDLMGPGAVIGVSTHTRREVIQADAGEADYLGFGPLFATASKSNHEPEVGLDELRLARTFTSKPLVAIGGITLERVAPVLEAGADAVAIIGALFQPGQAVGENARRLLRAAERPS